MYVLAARCSFPSPASLHDQASTVAHQHVASANLPSPLPALPQLPLLDKAAHRLLHDAGQEGLRAQMQAYRTDNAWVEQSALFRSGAAAMGEIKRGRC